MLLNKRYEIPVDTILSCLRFIRFSFCWSSKYTAAVWRKWWHARS
jgi:hypothetical protein